MTRTRAGAKVTRAAVDDAVEGRTATRQALAVALEAGDFDRAATFALARAAAGERLTLDDIAPILVGLEVWEVACALVGAADGDRRDLLDLLEARRFPINEDGADVEAVALYVAWKAGASPTRLVPVAVRMIDAGHASVQASALVAHVGHALRDSTLQAAMRTIVTQDPGAVDAVEAVLARGLGATPPTTGGMPALPARYRITGTLGEGGMGKVYRARDLALGRDVAVKVLASDDPMQRERFVREAQAAGKLDHPNIVAVYDVDPVAGWIAMELVVGESLGDVVARGKASAAVVARIAGQLLEALEAAHAAGIVHRDVKPSNIVIGSDGRAKLLDFGVAHLVDAKLTRTGEHIGTPAYMAPEQMRGAAVDARTDLYSLGATLYELVVGERLEMFTTPGKEQIARVERACEGERGLAALIAGCLQAEKDKRWPSARAARDVLAKPKRIAKPKSRVRLYVLIALAAVAGGVAYDLKWMARHKDDAPEEPGKRDWLTEARPHCNPAEVASYLATHSPPASSIDATGMRAACFALAGKLDAAKATIANVPKQLRRASALILFDVADPIAISGDDVTAGPMMEIVLAFQPEHIEALYRAGMSEAATGRDANARRNLVRFLDLYPGKEGWGENAHKALEALGKKKSERTVQHTMDGSVVE